MLQHVILEACCSMLENFFTLYQLSKGVKSRHKMKVKWGELKVKEYDVDTMINDQDKPHGFSNGDLYGAYNSIYANAHITGNIASWD